MTINTVAIIQARMGSSRLPGKVLREVAGKPMLWHIIERLKKVPEINKVVVATSVNASDIPLREFCEKNKIDFFAGSENDVLDRFYQAACKFKGDPLIRITGDCPFADPDVISRLIKEYNTGAYDHIGTATGADSIFFEEGRYPDGLDAECFSFASLEKAWKEADTQIDREHVTPYIWRNKEIFRVGNFFCEEDYSNLRWTVDNEADFELVAKVYQDLYQKDNPFLMRDILEYMHKNPELIKHNQDFIGKEGYLAIWQDKETDEVKK